MSHERIVVVSGAATGSTFEVDHEFVVGRGESGMGNLRGDSEISRRHARFYRGEDGRLLIEDLGSTNGTLVNGRRITGPRLLAPGDEVQLGETVLRYEAAATQVGATVIGARPEGAAAAPPPPVTPRAYCLADEESPGHAPSSDLACGGVCVVLPGCTGAR